MSFLQGLHGTVAAILICSLLLVDEAGLPLPIAPSEGLLLLTGVLIASDAFSPWIIVPLAFLAMAAGMMAGYGWARALGQAGLLALAERVHATDAYGKAQARLQTAGPWGIAIARLLPGLRPYATLISGAAEVDLRIFLTGALPALLVWEAVWVAVGTLVGLPIAHLLGKFERLALRGVVLIVLGAVVWFAVRHRPVDGSSGLTSLKPRWRAVLALVLDAAMVFSCVGGAFALGRRVLHMGSNGWIELLVAAGVLTALLIAGRGIQTPGETLFDTHYWHHLPANPQ